MTQITYLTIWHRFPVGWRTDPTFRKRIFYYILTGTYENIVVLEYGVITKIFLGTVNNYQWIVSLLMPIFREFNLWVLLKLSLKSAEGDFYATRIMETQTNSVSHSLFLAYTVGSIATLASSVVIMCTDFLINIIQCLIIVYLKHKEETQQNTEILIKLLQDLVIAQMTEFLVPLTYLLCLIMAYYGPNSEVIGNIGNSYWQYNSIEHIDHAISYLCIFFVIDFLCLVICFYLLWHTCKIDLYKAYAALIHEFSGEFAIVLGVFFNGYFAMNMISATNDLTLSFNWIHGQSNNSVT